MAIQSKARMNLEHFHDFYFLQALQVAIRCEIGRNPDKAFSKAVEKLSDDVDYYISELFPNLALRSFVYLYAACLGEARHAREELARDAWIPETQSMHREGLYRVSTNYRPTAHNLNVLVKVFDQKWSSGFGGKAWMNIAESLKMYFNHPAAAFIDYIIDLEHNGGCVFNKTDARDALHFEAEYPYRFNEFLDYKFRYDILKQAPGFPYDSLRVTRKTRSFLTRYENIFSQKQIYWVESGLSALDDYIVVWGDEEIHLEEKWAKGTDVSLGNFPKVGDLFAKSGLSGLDITKVTEKELIKKSKSAKAKMYKLAGEYLTPKVRKAVNEKIKTWLEWAVVYAVQPKKSVTYQVLPVTVTAGKTQTTIVLNFHVPYEGYGTKTETGFKIQTEKLYVYNKVFKDGVDGHIEAHKDSVVLCAMGQTWYFVDKKLEAFLD